MLLIFLARQRGKRLGVPWAGIANLTKTAFALPQSFWRPLAEAFSIECCKGKRMACGVPHELRGAAARVSLGQSCPVFCDFTMGAGEEQGRRARWVEKTL
jgi:hypothetical protein